MDKQLSSSLIQFMPNEQYYWRRKIRRWVSRLILSAIALTGCCYLYASRIEPNWIQVVPIELTIPSLAQTFDGFKIVQISDLHATKFMPERRLERIIQLVNRQQPDAIAITGDIITKRNGFDAQQLQSKLSQLRSTTVNLSVLGNHDHWRKKIDLLKQVLTKSQINNLDNQIYAIERGTDRLVFAGLDDPYWGSPDLPKILEQLPPASTAILLVHEPDFIKQSAPTHRFILQLSGHSHGGQIRIPFVEPPILPYGAKKYYAGLNRVEDTITYTNRGLGMTGVPYRFGSRPEITVFTLHSAV